MTTTAPQKITDALSSTVNGNTNNIIKDFPNAMNNNNTDNGSDVSSFLYFHILIQVVSVLLLVKTQAV